MISSTWLPYLAALAAAFLSVFILLRNRRSPVHRVFALGMAALALEHVFKGWAMGEVEHNQVLRIQTWSLAVAGLVPGFWLTLSLSMGRSGFRGILKRWKAALAATLLLPLLPLGFGFWNGFFASRPLFDDGFWKIRLGAPGILYQVAFLLISALVVANLERTLFASVGRERWQFKFLALGIGGLFACRIYTCTHALLFGNLDSGVEAVNSGALLVASLPILIGLRRAGLLEIDLYVSPGLLFRSLTMAAVGIYLVAVAFLSRAINYFEWEWAKSLRIDFLLVFAALLTLPALLLSDRLRQRLRAFLNRHFERPLYDYRSIWTSFTQASATVVDAPELCRVVVKLVAETLESLSVTIWLSGEGPAVVALGASTELSEAQAVQLVRQEGLRRLLKQMQQCESGLDLRTARLDWVQDLRRCHEDILRQARIRYAFPLRAQGEFSGILTLDRRVAHKELSVQEFDLLHAIADQAAAGLLNLKLSARLQQAKEMEVFQNMSAFFVHDLKNLAGRLTLTSQNLNEHFDNAEFREDACHVMQQSVAKIKSFVSRLTALKSKAVEERKLVDLNAMIESAVDDVEPSLGRPVVKEFSETPSPRVDAEQIQSVFVNLLLNAHQACNGEGRIVVRTFADQGSAIVEICDNGCGMSPDFIQKRLFRPFQTTKKEGMGIGLYQSKLIVEAHQGRIEVESAEGRGSTFRVVLPT